MRIYSRLPPFLVAYTSKYHDSLVGSTALDSRNIATHTYQPAAVLHSSTFADGASACESTWFVAESSVKKLTKTPEFQPSNKDSCGVFKTFGVSVSIVRNNDYDIILVLL